MTKPQKRGLAAASAETRKRVAQLGGKHMSRNREWMAEIGRKGGLNTSKDKEHMAEIGSKGGSSRK